MEKEKFTKGLDPLFKMTVESNICVKTLSIHYIRTIGELTGKSEEKIKNEITEIMNNVKAETEEGLKKHKA